jgi:alkanesulfonate monooxygenase SsuD/methylene tetrahydromethanopterin reductase-like flavin-dependent oxidoreductase (luciferase family)
MKLGVGLPGYLGGAVGAATVMDWARRADAAGFHGVAVHDRPFHDAWDPLTRLAAAAVTGRVRLATTVVLPAYDAGLLARQAAVLDQVSGGRLDLGVGLAPRTPGARPLVRPPRPAAQCAARTPARAVGRRGRARAARRRRRPRAGPAPPPAAVGRRPRRGPPRAERSAWATPTCSARRGWDAVAAKVPAIREAAERAGRGHFPIGALAYVALSTALERHDQDAAAAASSRHLRTASDYLVRLHLREAVHAGTDGGAPESLTGA